MGWTLGVQWSAWPGAVKKSDLIFDSDPILSPGPGISHRVEDVKLKHKLLQAATIKLCARRHRVKDKKANLLDTKCCNLPKLLLVPVARMGGEKPLMASPDTWALTMPAKPIHRIDGRIKI